LSKVAIFPTLRVFVYLEKTRSNFIKIFGVRKLESLGYRAALFAWYL